MADSSYFRDKAEQCHRLARDSTDPMLIKNLNALALEYAARADEMDGAPLGEDPQDNAQRRLS